MQITIKQAYSLVSEIILSLGFSSKESEVIANHFVEAELYGKPSHGLSNIVFVRNLLEKGLIEVNTKEPIIESESANTILVNGQKKTGYYVCDWALEEALKRMKKNSATMFSVGLTNTSPLSGMIGLYARKVVKEGYILLGFNNNSSKLVPHGSAKKVFGSNPLTIGIPYRDNPFVLDFATSKISWGHLANCNAQNKDIELGSAIDLEGKLTKNAEKGMEGGLLPIAGHKGSGLAFAIEILAGALTGSRLGTGVTGGWGSYFIIIDPSILRSREDFNSDVEALIEEVKSSQMASGVKNIFYPGEKSGLEYQKNIGNGGFEIDDSTYKKLEDMLDN